MNKLTPIAVARSSAIMIVIFVSGMLMGCEKILDPKQTGSDPVSVFNEVWTVMDQHYALFAVKAVDWNLIHDQYQLRILKGMADKDLFRVIDEMLETLKDGHITLLSSSDTATYQGFYELYAKNFNYSNLINNYLHNDYKTIGPVIYEIRNNTGYLYYGSFVNDISDAEADQLFLALKDTRGLIIDVRDNQGGKTANAERIFQRLMSVRKLVKYEESKGGTGHNDLLDPMPYYLSPSAATYQKPVCVLTNRSCFSACNDFVLYLSGMPNVTVIGDQTGGGGGIPRDYVLANGWKLQYTATMTLSPDKTPIENGILPDLNIGISSLDEGRGIDSILENAYRLLQ